MERSIFGHNFRLCSNGGQKNAEYLNMLRVCVRSRSTVPQRQARGDPSAGLPFVCHNRRRAIVEMIISEI